VQKILSNATLYPVLQPIISIFKYRNAYQRESLIVLGITSTFTMSF
jgi:hypothetical protein